MAVEVGKVRVLCRWKVRAFLLGGSIAQDDNRNSFGEEDTEAGTKRLTLRVEKLLREVLLLMNRAGRVLAWSHCGVAGSLLTYSPKTGSLGSRRRLPSRLIGKARFAVQEAGRRNGPEVEKECFADRTGLWVQMSEQKIQERGLSLRGKRLVTGKAELHRGRSVWWFPKKNADLHVSFSYPKAISAHYTENRNYR